MKRILEHVRLGVFSLGGFACVMAATCSIHAENWPRFRGPNGTGVSPDKGFPSTWSEGDYLWKMKIPGLGHSSPCIWDDHVFITSSQDKGRQRLLLDVSASTGKIRWTWKMDSGSYKIHDLSSYASATPTTDGKRIYVPFSKEIDRRKDETPVDPKASQRSDDNKKESEYALFAFDFEGKELWKYVIGPFESQHGSGTSPIVFEDLVILGNDQDGDSSIVAVDAATGKIHWKVPRNEKGADQATCYSTPLLLQDDGRKTELVFTSKGDGFTSFDPRTGNLNWRMNIIPERCVGSPVAGHGLVFGVAGGGGEGHYMAAVHLGGQGELDDKLIAWQRSKMLPYVPTPVLYGDHLYLWGDKGVVSCVDARNGKNIWNERVEGKYSGSPICVDGKLYCVTEEGEVVVIAASPEFKFLGRTPLGEGSHSTPAVSNGRLFIRGFEHLFCVEAAKR